MNAGQSATLAGYGHCIILRVLTNGTYHVQVWGGPNGDKLYTLKGIKIEDLK